ncbi:MAG: hypothetical protein NT166_12965 [Candidatus Aminicenantes bacterium]|nr:hypothetical protein [Candidatus Aminicenantes bacterium]
MAEIGSPFGGHPQNFAAIDIRLAEIGIGLADVGKNLADVGARLLDTHKILPPSATVGRKSSQWTLKSTSVLRKFSIEMPTSAPEVREIFYHS